MKHLIFQELTIISDLEKSAETFQFGPKRNLILGKNNKVGKTSLSTTLFWALGCKVAFPPKWASLSFRTLIKFSVGSDEFRIARTNDYISIIYPNGNKETFEKAASKYSEALSYILANSLYLKSKNGKYFKPAFPSMQFLSSYIHQDSGWGDIYGSFLDLAAYSASEKKHAIEYYLGIKGDDFFEPRKSSSTLNQSLREVSESREKIEYVFEQYQDLDILSNNGNINKSKEYDDLLEIKSELSHKLFDLKKSKFELKTRIKLLKKAESELFDDYKFATNNTNEQEITCPTCGDIHKNDIVSRFNLLNDRDSLSSARVSLEVELKSYNDEISFIDSELKTTTIKLAIKERVQLLPSDFSRELSGGSLPSLIEPVFKYMIDDKTSQAESIQSQISILPRYRVTKQKSINATNLKFNFAETLKSYLLELNVLDADYDKINQDPHNKIHVSGSDISRMTLAYFKSLSDFMTEHSKCNILPMVIDSPIQQEQDEENIDLITDFIFKWNDRQVLLFGKYYPAYEQMCSDDDSEIIMLEKSRQILSSDCYESLNLKTSAYF